MTTNIAQIFKLLEVDLQGLRFHFKKDASHTEIKLCTVNKNECLSVEKSLYQTYETYKIEQPQPYEASQCINTLPYNCLSYPGCDGDYTCDAFCAVCD